MFPMGMKYFLLLFFCEWSTQITSSSAPIAQLQSTLQIPRPFRNLILTQSQIMKQNNFHHLQIPFQVKEGRLAVGKVLSVGPGEKLNNGEFLSTQTKCDEFVIYPSARAGQFKLNGITHDLIQEGNILLKCLSLEPKLEDVSCFADHLLVEFLSLDEQSSSPETQQVITPNSVQNKFTFAKVIKVGPPYRHLGEEKVDVSPGDRILCSNEGPRYPISLGGKKYHLLHVQDVLAAL